MAESEIKKTKSEELAYLDFLQRKNEIVIPLIQRDYAQGRGTAKATEIRKNFIADLHKCLVGDAIINLDFVYGDTNNSRFVPLDGQQRLTTLFLLHLYLDGLRNQPTDALEFKFAYETRDSSRRFCQKIIESRHKLFAERRIDKDGKKFEWKPSTIIRDQSWWLNAWNADPTVAGMIVMLDKIHEVFYNDWKLAADNLFATDKRKIRFQFLPLEDFYDPDDLYIKMNARGLPLTDFEIFKSRWMEEIEKQYDFDEVKAIKTLIDVTWTDFLWPLRKEVSGVRNVDPFFQRLLKVVIANAHASLVADTKHTNYDRLFEANNKKITFSFGKYSEEYGVEFSKKLLERINEELTQLCGEDSLFTKFRDGRIHSFAHKWIDLAKIWKSFVVGGKGLEYKDRVVLYAFTRLSQLLPNLVPTDVNQWARLVRNLVENKRFNESSDAVKAIADIDVMLSGLESWLQQNPSSNIDVWASQQLGQIKFRAFDQSQKEEEVIKATLRQISGWEQELDVADKHSYLKGNIRLILYYANLIPVQGPFKLVTDEPDLILFQSYREKCMRLFDQAGNAQSGTTRKHLLVRTLFSLGDYTHYLSSWRINICNTPGDRDYSWAALFNLGLQTHNVPVGYLKNILDDSCYNPNDIEWSLETIINKNHTIEKSLWVRILASKYGHNILKKSNEGFLGIPDDKEENTLIYSKSTRGGYCCPVYILYLEQLLKDSNLNYKVQSNWLAGKETGYSISINDVTVYYWNGKWRIVDSDKEVNVYYSNGKWHLVDSDKEIAVKVAKSKMKFTYPDGREFIHVIPQNVKDGKLPGRLIYIVGSCRRVLNTYVK